MSRNAWISVAAVVAAAVVLAVVFPLRRSNPVLQERLARPVKLIPKLYWTSANANVFIAKQMGVFRDEGLDAADTIKPMFSHPAYRPASETEAAFAEIKRGRGTTYDPDMAGACLRPFRQNGYSMRS